MIALHDLFRSVCFLQDQVGSNVLAPARKTESRALVPGGERRLTRIQAVALGSKIRKATSGSAKKANLASDGPRAILPDLPRGLEAARWTGRG